MLLSYRDPQFWETFRQTHWKNRVPTVLRQPFKEFPFSEAMLLRAMQGFEAGLCNGDYRKHCLVSVGDKEKSPRRPLRALFKEHSESFEQLEKNCGRVFPKQNFGLMVTNMHAVDHDIWSAVAAFLQDARHCVDFPVPRAFMDLFYGKYKGTFTGLHKDTQEIFAFVIRGEKRILAWPFNYFLDKVKGLTPGDKYFNKRLPIDYRKYAKDAIVLEARAGDVLHWPSEYWHVADAKSKDFSGMLSLGILRPEISLSPGSSPFREKLMRKDPTGKNTGLLSQDMTDVITRPDSDQQLRWVTGFGFEIGGPMLERERKLPAERTVTKNPNSVILWQRKTAEGQLLVAATGHSIVLPLSDSLVALLEKLCRGEKVSVSNRAANETDAKIIESYWNPRCEFKIRKLSAQRDLEAWLVSWLLRAGAVK